MKKGDLAPHDCLNCGYRIVWPYPKDKVCPKCGKNYLIKVEEPKKKKKKKKKKKGEIEVEPEIIQEETDFKQTTVTAKMQGKVKVKKKIPVKRYY